jgi:hypothetical protein
MIKTKNVLILLGLIAGVFFWGCENEQTPVEPFQGSNLVETSKITIPIGAAIDSATFNINVTSALGEEVTLHRVTGDWAEMTATWNNFGGSFDAVVEGTFTPAGAGWYSVNVTTLVSGWVDSTYANYGILLMETFQAQPQPYTSKEAGTSSYLKIYWTLNGSTGFDSTDASADTYINSALADSNFGGTAELITGWQDSTAENQTLVRFEIEQEPIIIGDGCTRGYGYWKTHSAYGPAPYDDTWALLGEDSTFFLSGKSNYEVIWTPPSGGNAYYMLSHHYIATQLNLLTGADPSEVQEALDDATDLFNTYTPEFIGELSGGDSLRQEFISLKGMLEQYNEGEIGPGSCDDSTGITTDYKEKVE